MAADLDTNKFYPLWIDVHQKIISFKSNEEFEMILFCSEESKMNFVIEQGFLGYRIQ